jgi:hypothetical protein
VKNGRDRRAGIDIHTEVPGADAAVADEGSPDSIFATRTAFGFDGLRQKLWDHTR